MSSIQENIKRKILIRAFHDLTDEKTPDIALFKIAEDDIIQLDNTSHIVLEDKQKNIHNFIRHENVIIYPLGEYSMYESLAEFTSEEAAAEQFLPDAEYVLWLVAPDGRKIDCTFFDTTEISGNKNNDDIYINEILKDARLATDNPDDIAALMSFVDYIRQQKTVLNEKGGSNE